MTLIGLTLVIGVGVLPASNDPPGSDHRIASFWSWWQAEHARFESSKAANSPELSGEMNRRVEAIAPGLAWEFGRTSNGTFVLTVSPEGDFMARKITERWRRAAPRQPANWAYYPARQPENRLDGFVLDVGGKKFDVARVRFAFTEDSRRGLLDLTVAHPGFGLASPKVAAQAKFLLADWVLGEDDVERYVGHIDSTSKLAAPGAGIPEVRNAIARLRAAGTGEAVWSLVTSPESDRGKWIAMLNLGLKRLDHLFEEWHLTVSIPVSHPAPTGLPSSRADLALLQSAENALVEALAPAALHYGHWTGEGRYDVLLYVADRAHAERLLRDWLAQTRGVGAVARWELDPEWKLYRRW